jgi:uncharacterized protein YqeY
MIDINEKIKEAMKSCEKDKLAVYRLIKAKELEMKTAKNAKPFDEAAQINMLRKMVKEREESAKLYEDNNRPELATNELAEATIIKEMLPPEVSEDDINLYIKSQFEQVPKKEMGFVIKCVKDHFPTADGSVVARIVKSYTV